MKLSIYLWTLSLVPMNPWQVTCYIYLFYNVHLQMVVAQVTLMFLQNCSVQLATNSSNLIKRKVSEYLNATLYLLPYKANKKLFSSSNFVNKTSFKPQLKFLLLLLLLLLFLLLYLGSTLFRLGPSI